MAISDTVTVTSVRLGIVGTMRILVAMAAVASLLLAAAGTYAGKWSSSYGSSEGTISIRLAEPAEVSFTLSATPMKTKVVSVKNDGKQFEITYDFDLDGNKLTGTATGTVADGKMEGKYVTKAGTEPVDGGTFSASEEK